MRMQRIVAIALPLCAVVACSADRPPVTVDTVAEAAHIAALQSEWSELYGTRDIDRITALMAENSVLIVPGSAPLTSIEDIRQATRQMLESDAEVSWKTDFARVSPDGNMAYDYGTAITRHADGSTERGNYLVVWVKEHGEWKVAADMFN